MGCWLCSFLDIEGLDNSGQGSGVKGKKEQRRGFCGRKGWAVEAGASSSGSFDCAVRKERELLRSG